MNLSVRESVTDVTHFRNVCSGNETINQYYNAYAGNESPKMWGRSTLVSHSHSYRKAT